MDGFLFLLTYLTQEKSKSLWRRFWEELGNGWAWDFNFRLTIAIMLEDGGQLRAALEWAHSVLGQLETVFIRSLSQRGRFTEQNGETVLHKNS